MENPDACRWDTRLKLAEMLAGLPELTGITVHLGWPGEAREPEYVWLGPEGATGDFTIPTFTGQDFVANPVNHDDSWTTQVNLHCAASSQDLEAAHARCRELDSAISLFVRQHPQLDGTVAGLQWLVLGGQSIQVANFTEGIAALSYRTLRGRARISGGAS